MRRTVFAVVILLLFAGSVEAQVLSSAKGFGLGLHLNGSALKVEDADETDTGGGLGLRLGYGFTENIALFLNLDGAMMSSDGEDYTLGHADLGVRYTFLSAASAWRPSIDLAFTGRAMRADDIDFGELGTGDVELSGPAISIGGGVAYYFSPALALDLGLGWTFGKFNKIKFNNVTVDLEGSDRIDATSTRLNLGLAWFPGGGRSAQAMRR